MENNNSLEVFQKGEILDCNFERVDFNNSATVFEYGDSTTQEISNIFSNSSNLALSINEIVLDDKILSSVSSFDDSLEESEKAKEKLEKQPAIIKGLKGFLSNIGITKVQENEESETTYKARYQQYCEGIDKVCEAIETQKQAALDNMSLRDAIIKEVIPYIKKLENQIEVGKLDKDIYDKETEELKALPQTQDTQYEIQYRTQLSEFFNAKIFRLEKAVFKFKQTIQESKLQQIAERQVVLSQQSFLKDDSSFLKVQGSLMVFNHQLDNRINQMAKLNEATNAAIVNNAKNLEKNIQGAVDLTLNSGISMESLKYVYSVLKNGTDFFRESNEKLKQVIVKDREILADLKDSLDNDDKELLQLIDKMDMLKDDSKSITRKRY